MNTSKILSLAASFKNISTSDDFPTVRIISFEWICSSACLEISSLLKKSIKIYT